MVETLNSNFLASILPGSLDTRQAESWPQPSRSIKGWVWGIFPGEAGCIASLGAGVS